MLANSLLDCVTQAGMRYSYYGLSFPLTNWRRQESFKSDILITVTPLRAMRGFLMALNFSLDASSCLMIDKRKIRRLNSHYIRRGGICLY